MIARFEIAIIYIAFMFVWMKIVYSLIMKMRLQLHESTGVPMKFGNRDDQRDLKLLFKHHEVFPDSKLSLELITMVFLGIIAILCGMLAMMKFGN